MKRITYSGEAGADVSFTVFVMSSGDSQAETVAQTSVKTLLPESGEYVFEVDKILSPFRTFSVTDMTGKEPHSIKSLHLVIQGAENGTPVNPVAFNFLPCNCSERDEDAARNAWLTLRPQVQRTSENCHEPFVLSLLGYQYNAIFYMARCYFKSSKPESFVLSAKKGNLSENTLQYVDCSYKAVKAKAVENGHLDAILAYDIYPLPGSVGDQEPSSSEPVAAVRRLVVRRDLGNCLSFLFMNSFGGLDSVTQTGQIKTSASGDVAVFINDGIESETANDGKTYFEVNSGYISDIYEKELWYDFFRSQDRCVIEKDGTASRIVVDEYKCEYTYGELSSFTFKFHRCENAAPRLAGPVDIDDYYIEK